MHANKMTHGLHSYCAMGYLVQFSTADRLGCKLHTQMMPSVLCKAHFGVMQSRCAWNTVLCSADQPCNSLWLFGGHTSSQGRVPAATSCKLCIGEGADQHGTEAGHQNHQSGQAA